MITDCRFWGDFLLTNKEEYLPIYILASDIFEPYRVVRFKDQNELRISSVTRSIQQNTKATEKEDGQIPLAAGSICTSFDSLFLLNSSGDSFLLTQHGQKFLGINNYSIEQRQNPGSRTLRELKVLLLVKEPLTASTCLVK